MTPSDFDLGDIFGLLAECGGTPKELIAAAEMRCMVHKIECRTSPREHFKIKAFIETDVFEFWCDQLPGDLHVSIFRRLFCEKLAEAERLGFRPYSGGRGRVKADEEVTE